MTNNQGVKNIQNELAQCFIWAEYANDYESFALYDKDICPLDSAYFTVQAIKTFYNYCLHAGLWADDLTLNQLSNNTWVATIDNNFCGLGHTDLEATKDLISNLQE